MIIPKDVLILPSDSDRRIIYNVFSRTCLSLDSGAIIFLKEVEKDLNRDLQDSKKYYE